MSASESTGVPESAKSNGKGKRRNWIIAVAAVAIVAVVIAATLLVYYSPDYSWEASIRDHDGDGYADSSDAFSYDPTEWNDTDADSYGDNSDEFPSDPAEWTDTDGDGVGDNGDVFPDESSQWLDIDGDGYGDNQSGAHPDLFPEDASEWNDTDSDGYGDNRDVFPDDAEEWNDTDDDGVGDNGDDFPSDPTQWSDQDGDGYGDNATGTDPDEFPSDPNEWQDSDGDGVGDNGDDFPYDPTEWNDSDSDGVGDNADFYDFGNGKVRVFVDYYQEDGSGDFWTYGDPFFVIRFDVNFDGMWDYSAQSQIFLDSFSLSDPFSYAVDYPDAYPPSAVVFTIEVYESDVEGNYEVDYNPAAGGSYWTAHTAYWPYGNSWYFDGSADGGYEQDCILQFSIYWSG